MAIPNHRMSGLVNFWHIARFAVTYTTQRYLRRAKHQTRNHSLHKYIIRATVFDHKNCASTDDKNVRPQLNRPTIARFYHDQQSYRWSAIVSSQAGVHVPCSNERYQRFCMTSQERYRETIKIHQRRQTERKSIRQFTFQWGQPYRKLTELVFSSQHVNMGARMVGAM